MMDYLEALLPEQTELAEEENESVLAEAMTDGRILRQIQRPVRRAAPAETGGKATAEERLGAGLILPEGTQQTFSSRDLIKKEGLAEAMQGTAGGAARIGSEPAPNETGGTADGAVLLRAMQKASRNLSGRTGTAPGRYAAGAGERSPEKRAEEMTPLSMREIDLAFQRDSRRYDNGFKLY